MTPEEQEQILSKPLAGVTGADLLAIVSEQRGRVLSLCAHHYWSDSLPGLHVTAHGGEQCLLAGEEMPSLRPAYDAMRRAEGDNPRIATLEARIAEYEEALARDRAELAQIQEGNANAENDD